MGRLQFDSHTGADVPLGDDRGGAQLVHLLPAGRRDVERLGLRDVVVRQTGDRGGKRSGSERSGQEPLERGFGLPDCGPARREEAIGGTAERIVGQALVGRDDVVAGTGALDAVLLSILAHPQPRASASNQLLD